MDGNADAKGGKHGVNHLHEVNFAQQRVCTDNIGIALVEFAVAPALGTVGTPDGLHLEASEGQGDFFAMHDNVARKGHGEVVAQPLFAKLCGKTIEVRGLGRGSGVVCPTIPHA